MVRGTKLMMIMIVGGARSKRSHVVEPHGGDERGRSHGGDLADDTQWMTDRDGAIGRRD